MTDTSQVTSRGQRNGTRHKRWRSYATTLSGLAISTPVLFKPKSTQVSVRLRSARFSALRLQNKESAHAYEKCLQAGPRFGIVVGIAVSRFSCGHLSFGKRGQRKADVSVLRLLPFVESGRNQSWAVVSGVVRAQSGLHEEFSLYQSAKGVGCGVERSNP